MNHLMSPYFIFFRCSQVSTNKRLTNGNAILKDSTGSDDSVLFDLRSVEYVVILSVYVYEH